MPPLYPAERPKRLRKKHLYLSIPAVIFIMSGFYFFTFSPQKNQEGALTLQLEGTVPPLTDWVDEQPVFNVEDAQPLREGESPVLPAPPAPSMGQMKQQGCVADGFLSGYGGDINSSIALVNRSNCYYLHRALETWLRPPDFELAKKIQRKVTKPNTVYGMFIAEAIDTSEEYYYPVEQRSFNFSDMCRSGSKNFWGEHTCKPSLEREEYRKYVEYIAEQAMDMGIQSFLFGQVFYQDSGDLLHSVMPDVIEKLREYADFRGMKILIGAQTNDITDEKYLRLFDYIEGGVGLRSDGSIENGPCLSRFWQKPGDWCWGLLWHQDFSSKANNVFLHFDWSGKAGDDMSVFTRMDRETREKTLRDLYRTFTRRDMGFLMPLMATLYRDNGGCAGPKKRFYSASRKYSCQDEDVINQIIFGSDNRK